MNKWRHGLVGRDKYHRGQGENTEHRYLNDSETLLYGGAVLLNVCTVPYRTKNDPSIFLKNDFNKYFNIFKILVFYVSNSRKVQILHWIPCRTMTVRRNKPYSCLLVERQREDRVKNRNYAWRIYRRPLSFSWYILIWSHFRLCFGFNLSNALRAYLFYHTH